MNNQFLLFWFILEMLQTLTSILNQDVFDFHSSDTKKNLKVMIFISILISSFVVARTEFPGMHGVYDVIQQISTE